MQNRKSAQRGKAPGAPVNSDRVGGPSFRCPSCRTPAGAQELPWLCVPCGPALGEGAFRKLFSNVIKTFKKFLSLENYHLTVESVKARKGSSPLVQQEESAEPPKRAGAAELGICGWKLLLL